MEDDALTDVTPVEAMRRGVAIRLGIAAILVVLAALAAFGALPELDRQFYGLGLFALSVVAGIAAAQVAARRVAIGADRIVVSGTVRNEITLRSDIVGYWRGLFHVRFETKKKRHLIGLPLALLDDPRAAAFFAGLTDLDATLENDPALGPTREARRARLRGLRWRAAALDAVALAQFAVFLAALMAGDVDSPFWQTVVTGWIVSAAIVPLATIAISALHRKLPALGLCSPANGTDIAFLVFIPGGALLLAAIADVNLLDLDKALIAAAAIGVALALVTLWADPRIRRIGAFAVLAVAFAIWGYGLLVESNTVFDPGPGETYRAVAETKRKADNMYYVTVGPWGPMKDGVELSVFEDDYKTVRPGGTVTVYLCHGRFGLRYYDITPCA